VRADAFLIGN